MRGYRKYRRYMRRETGIRRKERTFHRWLAIFMAAVLLMSESNLTVLAEEDTSNVEVSEVGIVDEVSMEDADADNAEDMDDADKSDIVEGADDAGDADEDNTGGAGDDEDGADDVNDGEGLPDEDNVDENICVCENRCSEDMVNEDCPVCVEDYVNCIGQENEVLTAEDGVAAVADNEDEGIETYAVGNITFLDEQRAITYHVITDTDDDRQVEVKRVSNKAGSEVKIPESVTYEGISYRVTKISNSAFEGSSSLTDVEIPYSVTSIGSRAFLRCSSLKSIKIPDSVTSIGDMVFYKCSSLTDIKISNGVTSISNVAFYECSSLTNIEIPDNVTFIDAGAFSGCSSLTGIKIPDNVTSIGNVAFEGCSSLTSIEIPDSVTSIGDYAFRDCSSLTAIDISDNVTGTGYGAFEGCSSLTSIKIPDRVTNIDSYTFYGCSSLTSIEISNGIKNIGQCAFGECEELKTLQIVLPSDGTSINVPKVHYNAFDHPYDNSADRYIAFVAEDGSPLTGSALEAAQNAFKADARDSRPGDNFWWGWKLGDIADDTYHITYHLDGYEASQEDSTYTYGIGITLPKPQHSDYDFDGWYINADYSGEKVTSIGSTETGDKVYYGQWKKKPESTYSVDVITRRDDVEWENHGRTFMLLSASDGSLTANFETVKQGEYFIYDVTGVPSESLTKDGVNTGVRVSVEDKNVEVTVDYYTVTFYDGDIAYAAETPQAMQTVLGGKKAKEPDAPSKEGYKFRQWVTENESESFNFNTPIERKSSVYASWISDTAKEYCIAALADEGGSISPGGNVWVQEGGTQTFEIVPDDGYRIKSVTVDGMDRTDELTDSASARAIRAQAETNRYYTFVDVREGHIIRATFEKESGNTGDSGNTGTGDSAGDDGNTGTGDNGGGSGNAGMGDNTDDSDNAVINISNIENTGGSPAEKNDLNTNSGDARVISTSTNNNTSNPSKDAEPKTGDTSQVEIYATVAMIAGLTYLLLYFADKEKGMTEEKKQELVSSMIGWAKRGRRIRKYVILVPIFILLCYYHSIGKRIEVEWDEEPVWAEL